MLVVAPIAVETMSAEELRAMASYAQANALNDIAAEVFKTHRLALTYRTQLAEAKKAVLLATTQHDLIAAKVRVIDAQVAIDILHDRARTLKATTSIFQTLLRAVPT